MNRAVAIRCAKAILLGGAVILGGMPVSWAACTPASNPMGVNLTQVIEPPGGPIAGGLVEVTLRVTAVCTEVYDIPDTLRIAQLLPPGWAYDSMAQVAEGAPPDETPEPGEEGSLAFDWLGPTELPVTLTYLLFVPETERSVRQLIGQAIYDLGEANYASDIVAVDVGPAKENAFLCCGGGIGGGQGPGPGDVAVVLAGAGLLVWAHRKGRRWAA